MQGQSTEKEKQGNVVSLFNARRSDQEKPLEAKSNGETSDDANAEAAPAKVESFSDVMRRNAENSERLKKERLKTNQSVLKSYKIKH